MAEHTRVFKLAIRLIVLETPVNYMLILVILCGDACDITTISPKNLPFLMPLQFLNIVAGVSQTQSYGGGVGGVCVFSSRELNLCHRNRERHNLKLIPHGWCVCALEFSNFITLALI